MTIYRNVPPPELRFGQAPGCAVLYLVHRWHVLLLFPQVTSLRLVRINETDILGVQYALYRIDVAEYAVYKFLTRLYILGDQMMGKHGGKVMCFAKVR